jgi:hypothetical protein
LVEVVFQAVEVRRPQLPVGRQPRVEVGKRLGPDPVQAPLGVHPGLDQPRVTQDAKVLGHRGLAEPERADELADWTFPVAEQFEDRQPAWLGEGLKRGKLRHSTLSIPDGLYACQGTYAVGASAGRIAR